jgi:DNA-binding beta-propeller fold protein YncE
LKNRVKFVAIGEVNKPGRHTWQVTFERCCRHWSIVWCLSGNGTYLICNTAKQSPEISPLSVEFPDANLTLTPEIAVTYFTSILVSDLSSNAILRFRADVGSFIDTFVNPGSGGLNGPWGLAFGTDQNLYVASDGTSSVLRFDGSRGHFLDVFCEVANPRSLVFHLSDLYVCSSSTGMVLRFNGLTGSPRGIHTAATSFRQPWGIVFDSRTNESFVISQNTNRIVSVAPNPEDSFSSSKSAIWSDTDIMSIAGLELAGGYVFATSPDAGSIVAGFNRTTGKYLSHFKDAALQRPFDLKAYNNRLYVCNSGGVMVYNLSIFQHRAGAFEDHQGSLHIKHPDLQCAFLLIHQIN